MASRCWWCHDCGKQDLYWCNDCVAMTGRPRRAAPSAHATSKFEKGGSAGRSARPAPCRLRAVPRAVRQWPQAISSKLSTSFSLMLHTLSKSDTHQRCWAGARAWLLPRVAATRRCVLQRWAQRPVGCVGHHAAVPWTQRPMHRALFGAPRHGMLQRWPQGLRALRAQVPGPGTARCRAAGHVLC